MPESDDKNRGGRRDHERENGRARAVQQAAARVLRHGHPHTLSTPQGAVTIERLELHEQDGLEWVDIHVGGDTESGDPHFRVFNPPTLAEDPAGDIELHGRRWRVDPLLAVAQVVAQNGGAEPQRKLRGRRGAR